jgi:hypothetical protein
MNRTLVGQAASAGHILVVALFAAGMISGAGSFGSAVAFYGAWTGTATSYSFFAPGVASEIRVRYTVLLADGSSQEGIVGTTNREMNLRLMTLFGIAPMPEAERVVSRSIAARLFGGYPSARAITIFFDVYDLPSLNQVKTGFRPTWKQIHSAEFLRYATE